MLVIPTYNEKNNLRDLVKRIRQVLPDMPILFVDDNSPDGTAEEIRGLMSADPAIRLWVRPGKQGLGSAYRETFLKLLDEPGTEYFIAMDADLSHPPEILPEMVRLLGMHPVVVGSRYLRGGRVENWNWLRRLISRLGNWYARVLTRVPVSDLTSGFVGYRREALRNLSLQDFDSEGYAFQVEMKHRLHKSGANIFELPIVFTERREGASKFSFAIIMEAAAYPFKNWFSKKN
ncbi:MAG: polyprenol monophosphomannose synthase [Patescibacteria group bacterium]|nr:polyprenol monophosphomannose synthase [Patescibacteria group bacterium]